MPSALFFLAVAVVIVVLVLRLLRNRALREKYAAVWVLVGVVTVVLAAFPGLLDWVSALLGIKVGSNLLFLLGFLLLLAVALHLSLEISRLEDETRVLAEEAGILRLKVKRLDARLQALEGDRASEAPRSSTAEAVRRPAVPVVDLERDEVRDAWSGGQDVPGERAKP